MAEAVVLDQLRLRPATRADLPALVDLRRAVGWGSGGLEGSFSAVAAGRHVILLAEIGSTAVGAVTVALHAGLPAERGHVSDLLVSPLWRRRGVGTLLLRSAEAEILRRGGRECTLDVDGANHGALELYRRNGYERYRPAQFPWGPGFTLRKVLAPPAPVVRRGLWSRLGWPARPQ